MMEISPILVASDDNDFEYPSYKSKGNIIVRLERKNNKLEIVDHSCDCGAAPFYITELGVEYWFEELSDHDITEEGDWVFVGVHGHYFRGDRWTTDDDVEFYYDEIRRATDEESRELSIE